MWKLLYALYIGLIWSWITQAAQDVPLNQIQVLHAHNSFHRAPAQPIIDLLTSRTISFLLSRSSGSTLPPIFYQSLQYSQPTITDLLEVHNVRSLELDCFYDPEGGHYNTPAAVKLANGLNFSHPDLEVPGWKVLHIPDLDFNSTCFKLRDCLEEIRDWSVVNPDHIPIFISLEPAVNHQTCSYKPERTLGEDGVRIVNGLLESLEGEPKTLTPSIPVTRTVFQNFIDEILDVFDPSQIIHTSDIQGNASSLASAIKTNGWPMVSELRGRVLFLMKPAFLEELLRIYPNLEDSPFFPSAFDTDIDEDHTIFITALSTDPQFPSNESRWDDIAAELSGTVEKLVEQGYMVRAFTDKGTQEARKNFTFRRDSILQAGAHLIATDFPGGRTSTFFQSNYTVQLDEQNSDAVCNPKTANSSCTEISLPVETVTLKPVSDVFENEIEIQSLSFPLFASSNLFAVGNSSALPEIEESASNLLTNPQALTFMITITLVVLLI